MPTLSRLVLRTHKLEELCDFYECLGFDFEEEQKGKGPPYLAAEAGDAVLEIHSLPEGKVADATTRLGFCVPDVVVCCNAARNSGWRVENKPNSGPDGLRALLRDPDGRAVELTQEDA
ncbi:MAG: glyoxalase [Planctomycetia bacterium]|nr:glyoxalase [Planctomycetia bacterium]